MNAIKVCAFALLSFARLSIANAGDPAFCSLYTVTSVTVNGLNCYLRSDSINRVSDLGTFESPFVQATCQQAFGASVASFNFDSVSTATTPETQYTRRTQKLYTYSPDSLRDTQDVPTPVQASLPRFMQGFIFQATHEYIGTGGQTETCDLYLQFSANINQLDPVECNKIAITEISIPGLQCDRPLTGLNLVQSDSFEYDHSFATCVIPDEQTELSLNYVSDESNGVVVQSREHSIYNDAIGSDHYTGVESDPAVWPIAPPAIRPGYFDFGTRFEVELNGGTAVCFNEYRFTLQLASETSPPLSDSCTVKTQQECLNHFQNNTDCVYDFPTTTCAIDATDICQVHQTSQNCNDNGCLWDSHLDNCLASLAQVNSVFPCSYWNSYATVNANAACSFHGCLYDNNAKKCLNSNETISDPVAPVVSVDAQFINPVINTDDLTLSVQAVVPFVYTVNTPTRPRFPQVQVLFPSLDFSAYGTQNIPGCSSYQAVAPIVPVAFTTTADPTEVNAYLVAWFAANNHFNFDNSQLGQLAAQVVGNPRVGSNEVIRNVTYDGERFVYNITLSLPGATTECATRGAVVNDDSGTRVYNVPLSYIEQSPGVHYNQITKTFTVTIPTAGVAAVGSTSSYGFNAFPVSVVLTKGDAAGCLEGEGKMHLYFQIETYNVFDSSARVGLLSLGDIALRSPDSPPGPTNCYGDVFFEATPLACDYDIGLCSTVVHGSGQCRVLTTDGNAFKQCSYAKDEDRIAELGSDIPYDTALDGLHQFWVYTRVCPDSNPGDIEQCRIATSYSNGYPEHVSAIIRPSAYADEAQTANDFQVETGFLPSGNSALGNVITGTINDEGVLTYTLGQSGVITIFVAMLQAVRTRFDLRATITTGQTRIIPYSATGLPMSTVSGYTGPAFLSYSSLRARVLSTVKDDYFASCGAAGTCNTLPACNGIIGCDGFSIPVAQLRAILPADSYQIVLPYRIGLLNGDGSTPIARRRLLQTAPATRIGTATFRFIIDSTGVPVIVDNTNTNSTKVTVDLVSAIAAPDEDKAKLSFYMTGLTIIPLALIFYVATTEISKYCISKN